MKIKISTLQQTCSACPSQWDAKTDDGHPVYIRFRWGYLEATIDPWTESARQIMGLQISDEFDGLLSEDDMRRHLSGMLDWSDVIIGGAKGVQ